MNSDGDIFYVNADKALREAEEAIGFIPVVSEEEAAEMGLMPITRDLTAIEKSRAKIEKYSPCGCGSGKHFKFCCFHFR